MLSASAISIAIMVVVFMQGYIGGIVDSMFDSVMKIQTGHVKIMHSEYHEREDMMPLEYMVDGVDGGGYEQLVPILESVKGVKTVAPRIKFGVLLSYHGKTRSALGIGVDPEQEDKIAALSKTVIEGQYFANNESSLTMLIGGGLADKLGIKTGDKLTILARTAYDSLRGMTFTVAGVFRYGISSMDDKLFYIPIRAAARLLEMEDGVSEMVVMIDKPEDAEKVAGEIDGKIQQAIAPSTPADTYAVVPWQQQGGFLSMMQMGVNMYKFIYLALLILASTVIINTTMMVIYERTREIGTIGALGMTGGQIVLLFVIEAMIVSMIGSFMGIVAGGAIDFFFHTKGINIAALTGGSMDWPTTDIIYPRFGLFLLIGSFIFGVAVASAIAYFPARRAAKVEPVEALRSI